MSDNGVAVAGVGTAQTRAARPGHRAPQAAWDAGQLGCEFPPR